MMLLGDVREGQEMCERASHRYRMRQWESAEDAGQLLKLGAVGLAVVSALGQRAHLLDELKDLVTLVNAQRVAEQLAEQPDVLAQRPMWIDGGHVPACAMPRGPAPHATPLCGEPRPRLPADRATIRV